MGSTRPADVAHVHTAARTMRTLTEVVQDAWCSWASRRRVADRLDSRSSAGAGS